MPVNAEPLVHSYKRCHLSQEMSIGHFVRLSICLSVGLKKMPKQGHIDFVTPVIAASFHQYSLFK